MWNNWGRWEIRNERRQLTTILDPVANSILLYIDPDYKKFLEFYNGDGEKLSSTPETLLEEIEAKSKELCGMLVWY